MQKNKENHRIIYKINQMSFYEILLMSGMNRNANLEQVLVFVKDFSVKRVIECYLDKYPNTTKEEMEEVRLKAEQTRDLFSNRQEVTMRTLQTQRRDDNSTTALARLEGNVENWH